MDGSSSSYIMLVVMIVVFGGMMWWQSKKSKQAQREKQDFRRNLQPDASQVPIEASIESSEATDAETDGGNETETK